MIVEKLVNKAPILLKDFYILENHIEKIQNIDYQ